ncbi:MAG: LLM class flavin-dependent oxidoreductase [Solibacillus sp.]
MTAIHLNLTFHTIGFHDAAWRHPSVDLTKIYDVNHIINIVKKAEDAKLDAVFIADSLSVQRASLQNNAFQGFSPLSVLSVLATVTKNIGLIGTFSTTFSEPFNLARGIATVDHISRGRAGWNVVTTADEASANNFGLDIIPEHQERYDRATEFVDVVTKLWDSWDKDALTLNKETGEFADISKIHEVNHEGDFYKVKGPLNVHRAPQGRPVLVQAGASKAGIRLAAATGEIVFTAQQDLVQAKELYKEIKSLAEQEFGRSRSDIKILPGLCLFIGKTREEAQEKFDLLQNLSNIDFALQQLTNHIGLDFAQFDLDAPFPELPDVEEIRANKSRTELIVSMAKRDNLTLRQTLGRLTAGRGHLALVGTAEDIADHMETWVTEQAADGFNLMPQVIEESVDDIIELLIPELQKRGLFRTEYTGTTLRDHFGLKQYDESEEKYEQLSHS